MKQTALITGASNGIGLELAKIHATAGGDLVIIARSLEKLNVLKSDLEEKYGVKVYVIEKDLSSPTSASEVFAETTQAGIHVDYLINNAGFGDLARFVDGPWDKYQQMINLNITTLTALTHLYLPGMVERGAGKIMNVASTAAFQPGPYMAVYYATKAYVLHFSEAIAYEVRNTGVTITTLCPGPTESGFQSVASMQDSPLFKNGALPTSREVANYGYRAMMAGKTVAIHGLRYRIFTKLIRLLPRKLVVRIVGKMQEMS